MTPKQTPESVSCETPTMTAVLGFHAKDWIFVATDSQATYGQSKTLSGVKLVSISFKNGESALLAFSGFFRGFNFFSEVFQDLASQTTWINPRSGADCLEKAIKKGREKIWASRWKEAFNRKEIREDLAGYSAKLFLAYIYDSKPYFYSSETLSGGASLEKELFYSDGTGGLIAKHSFKPFDRTKLNRTEAAGVCVYVIEECKRADIGCGGDVQLGVIKGGRIHETPVAEIYPPQFISKISKAVRKTTTESNAFLVRRVARNFSPLTKDFDLE